MEPLSENLLESLRATVNRKMGWCILRLQQYELLMKWLVGNREISAYSGSFEARRANRKREVSNKTLGQLVAELSGAYLSTQSPSQDTEEAAPPLDPSRAHGHMRAELQMTEEEYESAREGLIRVLSLRNELVHHFLERFDLGTESGCLSAAAYLDSASQTINDQHEVLLNWCRSLDEARKELAAFIETPLFQHWIKFGTLPGQDTDWPNATIIHQLVLVERDCHQAGWTNLDRAIAIIRDKWPELTPGKYGCASWRQVIRESRLFDIKRTNPETGVGQTWYRSKSRIR